MAAKQQPVDSYTLIKNEGSSEQVKITIEKDLINLAIGVGDAKRCIQASCQSFVDNIDDGKTIRKIVYNQFGPFNLQTLFLHIPCQKK